ncbi:MAG: lytic transglycosylase domain-containing protein [Nitrospinae bacterium]|nr:lytic transglycosylase domain-containing protein [Nitrospinota bacterium]
MFKFYSTAKKGDIFFSVLAIAIICGLLSMRGETPKQSSSAEHEELQNKVTEIYKAKGNSIDEEELYGLSEIILAESSKYDIDPLLLLAIIETESSFSNSAVSNKNARGLMQIVPETAKAIALKEEIEWEGYKTLHTPATNIRIGTYYFKKLLRRFDGDVSLALAAYNNGPTRVAKLIRDGEAPPSKYSRKVLRTYKRIQKIDGA